MGGGAPSVGIGGEGGRLGGAAAAPAAVRTDTIRAADLWIPPFVTAGSLAQELDCGRILTRFLQELDHRIASSDVDASSLLIARICA